MIGVLALSTERKEGHERGALRTPPSATAI